MAVIKTEHLDGGAGIMQAPREAALHRPRDWFRLWEDFLAFPCDDQSPYLPTGGWKVYAEAGGANAVMTGQIGGVFELKSDGDAHDQATMTCTGPGGSGTLCEIVKHSGKPLFFETRVKFGAVADSGFFIGLTEEGLGDNLMTDTTLVMATDIDFVGFHTLIGTPTELDLVYQTANVTAVEVEGAADIIDATNWFTLAIHFDGKETVKWYVHNAGDTTPTYALVGQADVDDTGFPDGEELTITYGVKSVTGAEIPLYIDYVELIQRR